MRTLVKSLLLTTCLALGFSCLHGCSEKSRPAENLDYSNEAASSTQLVAECTDPSASIKLFINSPLKEARPSQNSQSPIGRALLNLVDSAEISLDIAVYGLRQQPEILDALVRAKNRGVRIRVVYDQTIDGTSYYGDTHLLAKMGTSKSDLEVDRETARALNSMDSEPFWPRPEGFDGPPQCVGYTIAPGKAVIAVHASKEPLVFAGDIMHHKFVIADKIAVWTGSCNLSNSGTGGYNANTAVVIRSQYVAQWFTEEFERMFIDNMFHRRKTDKLKATTRTLSANGQQILQLGFCPQDYCYYNIIEPALRSAKDSIDVAMFFLTHKRATGELIKAHRRGVKVRVIIDATAAKNGYTKHELLRAAGIPVKVENWGGKMHMKSALIDGKSLILGSMNWTSAGESKNDENVILLHDRDSAQQFSKAYEQLWNSIPNQWLQGRPDPESRDSIGSLSDGIDNDFDEMIDGKDPGADNPPPLDPLPPYQVVPLKDGYDLIKGNISKNGSRIYHLPRSKYYKNTRISEEDGERWFPSVIEAKDAGWRSSRSK